MIPSNEEEFNNSFGERQIYLALKDGLPDDYTVFHSYKWNQRSRDNSIEWGEADFTVFHRKYGVLVIEVKSGGIILDDGYWYSERTDNQQRNRMKMGPLDQANKTKYNLIDSISESLPIMERCRVEAAVWFPSISGGDLSHDLPKAYHPDIVLTEESLNAPEQAIKKAYRFYNSENQTKLSQHVASQIVKALAPEFRAVQSMSSIRAENEYAFFRLTNEQNSLLEYLDEQLTAAIQGCAGTGKTLLAVEKARRLSKDGKVLFLCFNQFLMEDLREKNWEYRDKIDFYNLQRLVIRNTKTEYLPELDDITDYLLDAEERWPYRHIVVDEGQDFHETHLELLAEIAKDQGGAFYVFYDENQLVQQRLIQECLQKAPCRLILRRNCRNTRHIATTSARSIDIEPVIWDKLPDGELPVFHILSEESELVPRLVTLVSQYSREGVPAQQITILTLKTIETSSMRNINMIGNHKIVSSRNDDGLLFTTVRRFKGLESDIIILIDVDAETFEDIQSRNLFYVGASRAKHALDIITLADETELQRIAQALVGKEVKRSIAQIASSLKVKPG